MSDEDIVPVRRVKYSAPKTALSSSTIRAALSAALVPAVVERCGVVAIRCIFEFSTRAEAVKQLAARRRQLELKMEEIDDVSFIYITSV